MVGRGWWRRPGRIGGLLLVLAVWTYALDTPYDPRWSPLAAVACCLGALPIVVMGRLVLDDNPTPQRAGWVTALVHYDLMVLLGPALVEAIQVALAVPLWPLPIPEEIGIVLVLAGQAGIILTMVNLALQGQGAPFAIALSRRLAVGWMYAWTRNPMVLWLLFTLVALGIWLQSGLYLLWVLVVFTPAIIMYLLIYEERELEIRFGTAYRDYKATTPMLLPRRPRPAASRLAVLAKAARRREE